MIRNGTRGWKTVIAFATLMPLSLPLSNAEQKQPDANAPKATTRPATVADLKTTARNQIERGNYSEALRAVEQILKLDPSDEYAIGIKPLLHFLERQLPELNFEGVGLGDVFEFFMDITDGNFTVDWKSLEKLGVDRATPVTLKLKNLSVSKSLDLILANATAKDARLSKISYQVDADKILIFAPPPKP